MKIIGFVLTLLLISGCSFFNNEPKVITETKVEVPDIIHPSPPRKLNLKDVEWMVLNKEKLESLLQQSKKNNKEIAIIALTPKAYENLSLNMQELKRYIAQQKEIILFYKEVLNDFKENVEEINNKNENSGT